MADKKISELTAASTLAGTEQIPVVQSSATVKTTPAAIATYINAAGAAASAVTTHENAYVHGDIAHSNRTALNNVSGVNTGDQDLSGLVPKTTTVNSKALTGNISLTAADVGAAATSHTHTQAESHNSPDTDSATTSLHHTIGTSATQAAAGNHNHTGTYQPVLNADQIRKITISTSDPSGGSDGDLWFKYTA